MHDSSFEILTAQHDHIRRLLTLAADCVHHERGELVDELTDVVIGHLALEQEVLYPCLGWLSDTVRHELLAEHAVIKRILGDLIWQGPEDPAYEAIVGSLSAVLGGHAAWQDEELFLTIGETMSVAELDVLAASLRAKWMSSEPDTIARAA